MRGRGGGDRIDIREVNGEGEMVSNKEEGKRNEMWTKNFKGQKVEN